ncbi:MAG: FAD-dependent oxidoreductase [Eubacteriales bacterium]
MAKKVLIVGGVAGGASCAARLRRLDEQAEIIMFERGEFISFANCGLPYYLGGTIANRDNLLLQTPESFNARFNVDVRVFSEVVSIDRDKKMVNVRTKDGKEYSESYDTLVLSPGSSPLKPPIPGIEHDRILSLWNIPDMDRIKSIMDEKELKTAAVIGGGFIGIEMAENLLDAGLNVTVVEMLNQVMAPVDYDMAQILHKHMGDKGVNLVLGDGVASFEPDGDSVMVKTQSGREVKADLVILAIGVRPNSELAKEAGLETNKRGGIVVDKSLKTSDENIYAVGDAIEVIDFNTKKQTMVPLAGPANKQGRMAADNIAGMKRVYNGTQGSSVAKVFDLTVANTGINQKQLDAAGKKLNVDYKVTVMHPASHAGYYPGGMPMTLKVIFDKKDGKVLGAQAVGYQGVDKRIDVLATAIRFGGTVYDLEELELCYAPPYSSAKDPVNMAGFIGENILSGNEDNITVAELADLPKDTVILDVRTQAEYDYRHIDGVKLIPVDELRERIGELDKSKSYVVTCAVGIRGHAACRILKQNGFKDVRNLAGGCNSYNVVMDDYNDLGDLVNESGNQEKGKVVNEKVNTDNTIVVDACGLQCPGPVMKLYEAMEKAEDGDLINIKSTDPGFFTDAAAWCARTKNTYVKGEKENGAYSVFIQKGCVGEDCNIDLGAHGNDKSMVVFSGDLDKAIASFIIANGGAAMGRKVTMFFTFWGLNILRKPEKVKVKKGFLEKMFGAMMPRGTKKLGLSKMNMLGMGSVMMKYIMKKKNVATLDELIESAKANGVRMVACTMSMDVLGIEKEELIDGIEYAGVASYLGAAESSDTNLFI